MEIFRYKDAMMPKTENKSKKLAAIMGVIAYLRTKEPTPEPYIPNQPSIWTSYSRQTIMLNRNMVQRRVIKR